MDWDDAKKAALKVLGRKGKVPGIPQTFGKTGVALGNSWNEFVEAKKSLKEKFDAHLTNWDKYQGARFAYIDEIERDNLGLDPKDKAENLKIVEARKLVNAAPKRVVVRAKSGCRSKIVTYSVREDKHHAR
jgi:hypothetical protein